MNKRFTFIIVIILLLTVAFAFAVSCADRDDFQTLVCGSTPNSFSGFGAVDVCNECYPCGVSDGVCPEDFYNKNIGQASCRFCPDPDCNVSISGFVKDDNNVAVNGATIVALYEPDIKQEIATTGPTGFYSGFIRTGSNSLFVRYEDYDSRIIEQFIYRENGAIANFVGDSAIEPGTCTEQCTDSFGSRCKSSCNGVSGCEFDPEVLAICDDKIAGSLVFLDEAKTKYVICCTGNVEEFLSTDRFSAEVGFSEGGLSKNANNLVTVTQRTRLRGERVNLQVTVWDSKID